MKIDRAVWMLLALVLAAWFVFSLPRTPPGAERPRSSQWPAARAQYLSGHPACEACGRGKSHALQVHHVLPFHLRPDLELNQGNLITLCPDCHFLIGHGGDFKAYNPHCREDAALILSRVRGRKYAP